MSSLPLLPLRLKNVLGLHYKDLRDCSLVAKTALNEALDWIVSEV